MGRDIRTIHFSPAATVPQAPLAGLFLWPDGQLQAYQVWEARDKATKGTAPCR